jgi:hypothetical protein
VIDPVSDYLELMEVYDDINITLIIIFLLKWYFVFVLQNVFDFQLIKDLLSRPDFRSCGFRFLSYKCSFLREYNCYTLIICILSLADI